VLWPDTFVDVDHNLNTAINKIREVLGDSTESPRVAVCGKERDRQTLRCRLHVLSALTLSPLLAVGAGVISGFCTGPLRP
jgi:hypothetical protein